MWEKAESAYKHERLRQRDLIARFNCYLLMTPWSEHRCTKLYGDMHRNGLSGGSGDVHNALTFPTMSSLHNAVKFTFDSRYYTGLRPDSLVPATTMCQKFVQPRFRFSYTSQVE
ncbi:unnamed protein product [Lasius platythorax]|uniref:Uncharacterized protein n=1 Tax=Lasius platythorax TaxID=488582 RepID=A0AAV2P309_9HYME